MEDSLSRKSARVFQPTVLFHSQSRNDVENHDHKQAGQSELVWPYMLSLRNYINSPWLQFQAAGNSSGLSSFMSSKPNAICPLGCSATSCPDQKHLTQDRRVDSNEIAADQTGPSYQALNLAPLGKLKRGTSFSDTDNWDFVSSGIREANAAETTPRPEHERSRGPDHDKCSGGEFRKQSSNDKKISKAIEGKKKLHCPFCKVSCSNHGQLRGHLRCHTGEKPFVCSFEGCTRQFARNEELTRHKRIHTGLRPFTCSSCKKTFGRKDHLQKHAKTHLEPGQKKTFVCPVCHQGYSRSDALTRHKATAHPELQKNVNSYPNQKQQDKLEY